MRNVKNTYAFHCKLGHYTEVAERLALLAYAELGPVEVERDSFIEHETTAELVTPIQDGFFFVHRLEKKALPEKAVKIKAQKRVKELEQLGGRKIYRKEARDIQDGIRLEMLKTAPIVSSDTLVIYHAKTQMLFVTCSGESLALQVIEAIAKVCEDVQIRRVFHEDLPHLMSTCLKERLDKGEPAGFGKFYFGDYVYLCNHDGFKATYIADSDPIKGIEECFERQCLVEKIELGLDDLRFRLNKDFSLKSIKLGELPEDQGVSEKEDAAGYLRHELGVVTQLLVGLYQDLFALFEYDMETHAVAVAADASATTSKQKDKTSDATPQGLDDDEGLPELDFDAPAALDEDYDEAAA